VVVEVEVEEGHIQQQDCMQLVQGKHMHQRYKQHFQYMQEHIVVVVVVDTLVVVEEEEGKLVLVQQELELELEEHILQGLRKVGVVVVMVVEQQIMDVGHKEEQRKRALVFEYSSPWNRCHLQWLLFLLQRR
jgi:hypothetical protein